jgi:hypothetical protein
MLHQMEQVEEDGLHPEVTQASEGVLSCEELDLAIL